MITGIFIYQKRIGELYHPEYKLISFDGAPSHAWKCMGFVELNNDSIPIYFWPDGRMIVTSLAYVDLVKQNIDKLDKDEWFKFDTITPYWCQFFKQKDKEKARTYILNGIVSICPIICLIFALMGLFMGLSKTYAICMILGALLISWSGYYKFLEYCS